MEDRIMRKIYGNIIATLVALALAFGVPIASRTVRTEVKADDYELVWSDEFNGTSLDMNNWNIEVNGDGGGNNEKQFYTDSEKNISVSDGSLKIHALNEKHYQGNRSWDYTSGRITTQGKRSFKFGKIEARIKIPRFQGAWPAFWMLGDNIRNVGWPRCGEIDIMEAINNDNIVYSNLHWYHADHNADTQNANAYNVGDRTQWHTYTMEWDKSQMLFYCDGVEYQRYSITSAEMSEFRANQFIILNLAIGGNWPGFTIDNSAFPDRSTMEVDYVRVYQKPEEATTKYDGPTIVVTEDSVEKYTGTYNEFFGKSPWIPASGKVYPIGNPSEGYKIDVESCGYIANDSAWCVQGNLENLHYYPGATYTYSVTLLSNVDKRVYVKVAQDDDSQAEMAGGIVTLRANEEKTLQYTVKIPDDFNSKVSLKFGWGKVNGDTISDNGSFTGYVKNVSFSTTASIPDPGYTTKPVPTTTKPVVTTKPSEVTTSKTEPATTETTTKSVTPSKKVTPKKKVTVVKVGKTKIKKVKKKKKSLKFKLKKIKGASGYQIRYSDAKNFDGYWEKNVKKAKVKLKKLDRKTKYYIKARAYKKKGNIYFFGKFSKVKKAKTK